MTKLPTMIKQPVAESAVRGSTLPCANFSVNTPAEVMQVFISMAKKFSEKIVAAWWFFTRSCQEVSA